MTGISKSQVRRPKSERMVLRYAHVQRLATCAVDQGGACGVEHQIRIRHFLRAEPRRRSLGAIIIVRTHKNTDKR